jgi:hypothetical protein
MADSSVLASAAALLRRCVERAGLWFGNTWGEHDEVLLWIVSLGALTSFDQENNGFFSQQVVQIAKRLNIHGYQDR